MEEILKNLLLYVFLISLFPLIKASKNFYTEWTESENEHWQMRGCPPFIVFHLAMFLFLPMIFGKDLEQLSNKQLTKHRDQLRYWLVITFLLSLACQLNP